jgi:hypothetical protein
MVKGENARRAVFSLFVCESAFCHYGKIPEIINLKGRKVCFESQFLRSASMVSWSCYFGPMWHTVQHGRNKWKRPVHFLVARKQRERPEGARVPMT